MNLLFHEHTQRDLSQLMAGLPHALGLHGAEGAGLIATAHYLARGAGATVEVVQPEKKDKIDPAEGRITIDIIRRLRQATRSKSVRRRCIIITAADTMTADAQNAFLKLLEEPVDNLTFILLIHHRDDLLPTVSSRLQFCLIRPITDHQSELLLDRLKVTDPRKRQQLLFIARGNPAQLTRLAEDKALFEAEAAMLRQARAFVQGSLYEQLVICHEVKGSRTQAQRLIMHAMNIMRYDIRTKQTASTEIMSRLVRLERAARRLNQNGNPRLVLAEAVLMG